MSIDDAASPLDRRRLERRSGIPIAELTLPELRRIMVTAALFAVVLALFLWMVRAVLIAALLGLVVAFYMRPLDHWLTARLGGRQRAAALLALVLVLVPFVAVALYSFFELIGVAEYLSANQDEVSRQIADRMQRLPVHGGPRTVAAIQEGVARAAAVAEEIPEDLAESLGHFAVASTIFLLTAFYFLSQGEGIARYLRSQVPGRYRELTGALEESVRGVLSGTIYATLVTQSVKSTVIFVLNLIFGVPLAAVLAVASFVIGFFPIVGSWSIYLPVAGWLLLFRDDVLGATVMLLVGVLVNTVFISTFLRPKLAADRSHVLDFYWMFLGLVTGVYTFGLAGVVLGPILIGLLKAILETITSKSSWRLLESEFDLAEERPADG